MFGISQESSVQRSLINALHVGLPLPRVQPHLHRGADRLRARDEEDHVPGHPAGPTQLFQDLGHQADRHGHARVPLHPHPIARCLFGETLVICVSIAAATSFSDIFSSFTDTNYMSVFAIALPFTNPYKFDTYTVSLAHHVIIMWFLKCRLSYRQNFVQFIITGLNSNVIQVASGNI